MYLNGPFRLPLLVVIRNGNYLDIFEHMLEFGANLNRRNVEGFTCDYRTIKSRNARLTD